MKAKAVVTTDIRVVGGQSTSLKEKVVAALNTDNMGEHEVEFVLVARRQDSATNSEVRFKLYIPGLSNIKFAS